MSVDLPAPFSPSSPCRVPVVDVHADAVIGADRPEVLVDVAQLEAHVPLVHGTP